MLQKKTLRTQMGDQVMKVEMKGYSPQKIYTDNCGQLGGIMFIHFELH